MATAFCSYQDKINDNGSPDPSHGYAPVLLTIVSNDESLKNINLSDGGMKDIAPTMLGVMGLDKPEEMTGESLVDT